MRLEVDNLKVSYGLTAALKGFSLRVEEGQAVEEGMVVAIVE